jgi:ferredoxin
VQCNVRFERAGREKFWDGTFATLLEFGEAAGVTMPSGCRAGSCGECMMAIRSGATTTIKQPGIQVPIGHCLACISVPTEALVLDA